jgi:glycosyltransferase involved in cell wall biosynthesis
MTEATPVQVKQATEPLISVIVPCYRLARYLPEAVGSLIEQTHKHWECIVVNDGSPDDTREVAAELARRDARVRYIEQPNRGQSSARNRGLAEARGRFIQFLDADDLLLPHKLATDLEAIRNAAEPSVVIGDYWLMDEAGHRFDNHMCTPEFKFDTPLHDFALRWETELSIPPHAFLFDARLFRDDGIRFDETLRNHEDWDCWMHVFRRRPVVRRVAQKLVIYRVRMDSLSRAEEPNWRGFRQAIDLQIEACAGDATLRRMLVYKRKLNDFFYGKTWRVRALGRLRRSRWVPRAVQRALLRWLDLQDLRAHGWR